MFFNIFFLLFFRSLLFLQIYRSLIFHLFCFSISYFFSRSVNLFIYSISSAISITSLCSRCVRRGLLSGHLLGGLLLSSGSPGSSPVVSLAVTVQSPLCSSTVQFSLWSSIVMAPLHSSSVHAPLWFEVEAMSDPSQHLHTNIFNFCCL